MNTITDGRVLAVKTPTGGIWCWYCFVITCQSAGITRGTEYAEMRDALAKLEGHGWNPLYASDIVDLAKAGDVCCCSCDNLIAESKGEE